MIGSGIEVNIIESGFLEASKKCSYFLELLVLHLFLRILLPKNVNLFIRTSKEQNRRCRIASFGCSVPLISVLPITSQFPFSFKSNSQ